MLSNQARVLIRRWDILDIYRRAASGNAAHFLDAFEERMPVPVKAIQVDGGSGCDQESGNRRQFPDGKHTLKHVRDIWQPKVFDRSTYNTWEAQGKKAVFDKATEMAGWILVDHKRFLWNLVWHRNYVELLRQHNEI